MTTAAPRYFYLHSGALPQLRFAISCDTFRLLHRGGLAVRSRTMRPELMLFCPGSLIGSQT
jgi:hypothetical protein